MSNANGPEHYGIVCRWLVELGVEPGEEDGDDYTGGGKHAEGNVAADPEGGSGLEIDVNVKQADAPADEKD